MVDEDYYIKRANEIVHDKWLIHLIYMIGKDHNISKETIDKDKHKEYFIKHVINYLKHEQE